MSKLDESELFIVGAGGQLGTALRKRYPEARFAGIDKLDITDLASVNAFDWSGIKVIINAAAYTNVDEAETSDGRIAAWKVNAQGIGNLIHPAWREDMTIVHISTDYVFDGLKSEHTEDEPFSPLSVYGASKAAGDLLAAQIDKHYILRTSWVIGEGKNFVQTMLELGAKGVNPIVVNDQIGRLTFTSDLVNGIDHLLRNLPAYGTYNLSNEGDPVSWARITEDVFKTAGYRNTVIGVTTDEYFAGKEHIAPRPLLSTLELTKIKATGFVPRDWHEALKKYIKEHAS